MCYDFIIHIFTYILKISYSKFYTYECIHIVYIYMKNIKSSICINTLFIELVLEY